MHVSIEILIYVFYVFICQPSLKQFMVLLQTSRHKKSAQPWDIYSLKIYQVNKCCFCAGVRSPDIVCVPAVWTLLRHGRVSIVLVPAGWREASFTASPTFTRGGPERWEGQRGNKRGERRWVEDELNEYFFSRQLTLYTFCNCRWVFGIFSPAEIYHNHL